MRVGRGAAAMALVIGWLAGAAPLLAQDLSGVVLGPDGQPLASEPVALHRVGGGAGAFVATDTTDGAGAFQFQLEPDSAVYFVAVRFQGRMYLGPAVQPGASPIGDYVLQVDPANEAGAVASAIGQRPPPPPSSSRSRRAGSSDTGALLLVGLLALAAAVAFFFAAPRYRARQTREALIQLATIENALAEAEGQDRAELEADRDRLRERLAPRS